MRHAKRSIKDDTVIRLNMPAEVLQPISIRGLQIETASCMFACRNSKMNFEDHRLYGFL